MPARSSFRLVHFIALALVTCMGLTIAIMSAWTVWQLKYGFNEYLQAHDSQRLDQFARHLEILAQKSGGVPALLQQPWPVLLDQLAASVNNDQATDSREPDPMARLAPPYPPPHPPPDQAMGHRPPPPGQRGPDGFSRRLSLMDLQGQTLEGPPVRSEDPSIRAAVRVDGQPQAYLNLRTVKALPDPMAQRFLQQQYRGLAGLALVMLCLTIGIAMVLARRWSRPLQAASHTTARIAQGDWSSRIAEHHLTGWRTELDDLMHHINQMAQSLQDNESTRKRWLADISHELRTPLSVLQAEVDALLDGVRPLTLPRIGSLREEVLRLSALVNDLHLLAMADLQALPCHFQPGDAVTLLNHIHQRFVHMAETQGVALSLDLAGQTTLPVQWDMHRMTQVLSNLVGNSLSYTDAPGRAVMRLRQENDTVVMEMEDSAPGVPTDDLARLLDPLFRVQSDRARAQEDRMSGSGLGLSIAHAIVKVHGGHIDLAASAWGGLRVRLTLPINSKSTEGMA